MFDKGVWFVLAKISVYLYPIVSLLSGIPVFSIIVRYNLLENKICNKGWANFFFFAVVCPWLLSIPFLTGGLTDILSWVGLAVNGVVNFVIPIALYIISMQKLKQFPDNVHSNSNARRKYDSGTATVYHEGMLFQATPPWVNATYLGYFLVLLTAIVNVAVIVLNIVFAALGRSLQ